jgi:hypothetical protein
MRFRLDRRWAMLVLAVVLGATGGSVLGVVTAPGSSGDVAQQLGPPKEAAAPTTRRPRGRVEGISSTTRPRWRFVPAPTSTARPTATSTSTTTSTTTTTAPSTSTTLRPTTTSTTTTTPVGQDTTSSTSGSTPPSSTTSTTSTT